MGLWSLLTEQAFRLDMPLEGVWEIPGLLEEVKAWKLDLEEEPGKGGGG